VTEEVRNELIKFNQTDRKASLWYLSCPYSDPDPAVVKHRIEQLQVCVAHIISEFNGVIPFSPVLYTVGIQKSGIESPPEGWYVFDLGFLYRWNVLKSDRLIVLQFDGWESSVGVALEVATAEALGLTVLYYTVDELLSDGPPF